MKYVVLCILLLTTMFSKGATLKIGVKESAPFAFKHTNGHWDGIAIDLVKKYLDDTHQDYQFVECDTTYDGIVDLIARDKIDIFAGDMTITHNRLDLVNFSQPYYVTNTSIATLRTETEHSAFGFLNFRFLRSMLVLLLFVVISGFVMWMVEKDKNESFNKGLWGIVDGTYFVSATMTTVGYGDISAKTKLGKVLSFLLMWLSLGMVGYLYGNITASLTVAELENQIENVSQLNKMKVGTMDGTASAAFLDGNDVKFIHYDSTEEGLNAIVDKELDAFVYDKAILQHYSGKNKYSHIVISESDFIEQTYGFAMSKEFPDEYNLNHSILSTIRSDEWTSILDKYNVE